MKRLIGDFNTVVQLEDDEPKQICRLGQGSKCCAFLVCGSEGFECFRMNYPGNMSILNRIDNGTMNAKGTGGWKDCAWEGIYYNSEPSKHEAQLDSDPG